MSVTIALCAGSDRGAVDSVVESIGRGVVDRDMDLDKLRATVRCSRKANDFHEALQNCASPGSAAKADRSDRGRTMADILYRKGGQRPAIAIDAIGRQPAGRRARGEEEVSLGIEAERARHRFGVYMAGRGQQSGFVGDPESGDAVVSAITHIEKPARRRQVDLRARIAAIKPGRKRRDRLQRRQSAVLVYPVRDDTAALLAREIDKVEVG